jgi:hypothetical protein
VASRVIHSLDVRGLYPDLAAYILVFLQEKFLQERIKVNGKTNNLGGNVSLERQKSKVVVSSEIPFSKR